MEAEGGEQEKGAETEIRNWCENWRNENGTAENGMIGWRALSKSVCPLILVYHPTS